MDNTVQGLTTVSPVIVLEHPDFGAVYLETNGERRVYTWGRVTTIPSELGINVYAASWVQIDHRPAWNGRYLYEFTFASEWEHRFYARNYLVHSDAQEWATAIRDLAGNPAKWAELASEVTA